MIHAAYLDADVASLRRDPLCSRFFPKAVSSLDRGGMGPQQAFKLASNQPCLLELLRVVLVSWVARAAQSAPLLGLLVPSSLPPPDLYLGLLQANTPAA